MLLVHSSLIFLNEHLSFIYLAGSDLSCGVRDLHCGARTLEVVPEFSSRSV